MAIVTITEINERRRSSARRGRNGRPEETEQRAWRVEVDDAQDGPRVAREAVMAQEGIGLGIIFNPSSDTLIWRSIEANPQEADNPYFWIVEAEASSLASTIEPQEDPLDEPELWFPNISRQIIPFYIDRDNKAVVSSAGELINFPPETTDVADQLIRVRLRRLTYNGPMWRGVIDTVNDAEFHGAPAKSLRCLGAVPTPMFENGISFYEIDVDFIWSAEDLDMKHVMDKGYCRQSSHGQPVKLTDPDGNGYSSPQLLDGDGFQAAEGDPPVLLPYKEYNSADWTVMGLQGPPAGMTI